MNSLKSGLVDLLHKISPKQNKVVFLDNMKGATNAIGMANYVAQHYTFKVYYVVNANTKAYLEPLMNNKIQLVILGSAQYWKVILTSKYVFSTHGPSKKSKRQTTINIWHGVGHKKFACGRGMPGHYSDVTVATSDLSKEMLSYFFGVSKNQVFISGYPRNDEMLNAFPQKEQFKKHLGKDFQDYDLIVFWMPTHRRQEPGVTFSSRGKKVESIFNVKDFDVVKFNALLEENNTLCLIKPHYFYEFDQEESKDMSNIQLIGEEWIWERKMNLYQLLACADVLITDFSSVMTDFSLLDLPIIIYCEDLKEVYEKDELFFDRNELENYLPAPILTKQDEFFSDLEKTLKGEDLYSEKRKAMCNLFFKYKDHRSCERLAKHVFKK